MNFNDYGDKEIYRWTNQLKQYTHARTLTLIHIDSQAHTPIHTDAHAQETRVALPSFRSLRVPKSPWADWRLGGSPTPTNQPPLTNLNPLSHAWQCIRVCFIEHFIALTYGTIKIDLSHSKHKSVAKPKARQSYNVALYLLVYRPLSLSLSLSFSIILYL